jgi:hypothetical protein
MDLNAYVDFVYQFIHGRCVCVMFQKFIWFSVVNCHVLVGLLQDGVKAKQGLCRVWDKRSACC